MINIMTDAMCLCGSAKLFENCCKPYLEGKKQAPTPEALMRSRFSAYALGGYGAYLLRTWFPVTAKGLTEDELSHSDVKWQCLEVVTASQNGDQGTVVFKATFQDADGVMDVMCETSAFQRIAGRWLYVGGEVSSGDKVSSGEDVKLGRNDPCSCHSGKKYKKCCGKN